MWGLGNHAQRNLLPAIVRAPEWHLAGVHSRNATTRANIASEYRAREFASPDDMLACDDVQAVLLAGPNAVHASQAAQVMAAGKHVFVEKSLACSLSEATDLIGLARAHDVVLAECFMYAYHAQFRRLQSFVHSQSFGKLQSMDARFGFPHLPAGDIRYSSSLGGGALNDVGAYCVSAALRLLESDPIHVTGFTHTAPGYDVDTSGAAVLGFAHGVSACAEWGFGRAYANDLRLWFDAAVVTVERAFSKPETLSTTVVIRHQQGGTDEVIVGPDNHFVGMLANFHEALELPTARESLLTDIARQAHALETIRQLTRENSTVLSVGQRS